MQILTRCKCSTCEGQGLIVPEIWKEFFIADEEHQINTGQYMNDGEFGDWFDKKGYDKIPDEEVKCHECEGTGKVEQWMDAKEVIKYLTEKE